MPYILIYEPKEGLKYYVQKYFPEEDGPPNYRINGLKDNACWFGKTQDAVEVMQQFKSKIKHLRVEDIIK